MRINEISLNPQMFRDGDPLHFRIGESVIEGGHVVEKITFHSCTDLFNKGRETTTGCYAIFFVGILERRLIMDSAVSSIELVVEKKKNKDAAPELPD